MKVELNLIENQLNYDYCNCVSQEKIKSMVSELKIARKAISLAQSLFSEEDAFNAVSHFNVAFELKKVLGEYEEMGK